MSAPHFLQPQADQDRTPAPPGWPGPPRPDSAAVAGIAVQIDARMQSGGRVLAEVLEALDLITGQLGAVCNAVADTEAMAALDDLHRFAAALHELPARRSHRLSLLARAGETQRRLGRSVVEIRQILQILGIYGLNVTIAAASSDHSDDLIRSMSARLAQGHSHVTVFAQRLDAMRTALASLIDLDETLARECVRVVPAVPDSLHEVGRALSTHQHAVLDLGQRMGRLVTAVRDRVAAALGALQIGDSTRQRLEHVATGRIMLTQFTAGLQADEAAAAELSGAHLLAAQIRAAAERLAVGTSELGAVFSALAPDAAALRRLREDSAAGAEGLALLRQLQVSVYDSEALTQRLRAVDGQTATVTGLIGETVRDLKASLADIGEIRSDVHHMAINIGLRYRGEDGVGAAARVVASEINLYSRRLDDEAQKIDEAIATMADLSAALDHSALQSGDGGGLGAVVAVIGRGTRAGQGEVAAARKAIEAVLASLTEAQTMLIAQERFGADLRLMVGPDGVPPQVRLPATYETGFLTPLRNLYTMAEERRLHDSLHGSASTPAAVALPPADDDPSDFTLF